MLKTILSNALIVAGIFTLFTSAGVFYMISEVPPENVALGWGLAIGVLVLAIVFIASGVYLRRRD